MNKPDGGPIFPIAGEIKSEGIGDANVRWPHNGMSLRDWFAGMALDGLLARGGDYTYMSIGEEAYILADAMLKARESQ